MFPEYWQAFSKTHGLVGASACLGEEIDLSGLGADMQFLDQAQSTEELSDCWPGIGVAGFGYIPVASCLTGSGDYYYINRNDGPNGALYRIYHDAVFEPGDGPGKAVAMVLANYASVLPHVER